jgi:hypothetical protein
MNPGLLIELTTGYWRFKAMAAAVDIGLFAAVDRHGEATSAVLAADLGLQSRPLRMLLSTCTALGFLTKDGDRYRNAPVAAEYLVPGKGQYFGGFVRYNDMVGYPAWGRLQEALRTNAPTTSRDTFMTEDPIVLDNFWDALFAISSFTAMTLADAYDFGRHQKLLDVGGGMGAFPVVLCERFPDLRATVYDLPHVVEKVEVTDRISVHAGDFLADAELPQGHDVILLSMVLHDWDEQTARLILEKCCAALPSGGALIICELVLDDDETGTPDAALMGLNMLVETGGGQNWTGAEYREWLTGAGFRDVSTTALLSAGANAAIVACK